MPILKPYNRRSFLGLSGAGWLGFSLSSCERVISRVSRRLGDGLPPSIAVASQAEIDGDFHFLSRATFGPWPGDVELLRAKGRKKWLEEQLKPESIGDAACQLRAGGFESIQVEPDLAYEFGRDLLRSELVRHSILRAVYSKRQLLEVMAEFWSDHLNIFLDKGDCIYYKATDDRTVIRAHALGNFRDLIRASATSQAMLIYLDGRDNKVRKNSSDQPNENYARELLELHTLGVNNGYSQQDVREAARCLTGWRMDLDGWRRGVVRFDAALHDDGTKTVLGQTIPAGGGKKDTDALIDIVCAHPATARYIAQKLCRRFVSQNPPVALVKSVAKTFADTKGDIPAMLRLIFESNEFAASKGQLFKRPFRFLVSALRCLGADTHAPPEILAALTQMGQLPFQYPTPDGYPDEKEPWTSTLFWRWNLALSLVGNTSKTINVPLKELSAALQKNSPANSSTYFAHCVGRAPKPEEIEALEQFGSSLPAADCAGGWLAMSIASPAFQAF